MSKRQLSAKEILADIRSGMDDAALMEKYKLSAQGLQSVFRKFIAMDVLKQTELDSRVPSHERTINVVWKCPACGKTQPREFEECPDCGVIAAKFLKQQEEKRNRGLEKQLQQKKEKSREKKKEETDTERAAFCNNCGQVLPSEGLFCAHCGAPVRGKLGLMDKIQGLVSNVSRLAFLKDHKLIVLGTIAAIFIIGILAFEFKAVSDARKETLILYEPMRNEIGRDRKMLEMGLSTNDHREMTKSFVQRLGELQFGLKGQKPDLVSVLEDAAKALQDAEEAWRKEIEQYTSARQEWCPSCSHQDMYALLQKEVRENSNYERNYRNVVYDRWTEAIEKRQASWRDFKEKSDKALSLMTGK